MSLEMLAALRDVCSEHGVDLQMRVGIHSGPPRASLPQRRALVGSEEVPSANLQSAGKESQSLVRWSDCSLVQFGTRNPAVFFLKFFFYF